MQQYTHLPTNIQNHLAALPPLRPVRHRRRPNAPVQLVPPAPAEILPVDVLIEAAQIGAIPPALPVVPVNVPIEAAQIGGALPAMPPALAVAAAVLPVAPVPVVPQPVAAIRDLPAAYLPVVETQARCRKIDLKNMDLECPKCGALHWACERLARSTIARPAFGTCCLDGKVKIPKLLQPPRELLELYNGVNHHSKHFLAHITSYNNAFAMVSLSHTPVNLPGGPQSFTITGELKHMSGSLLPEPGKTPVYAQVYFQTNEQALDLRIGNINHV